MGIGIIWRIIAAGGPVILCACTIVHVDGPARVSRLHAGVLRVEPGPDKRMVAVRTSALGLSGGHDGMTLGYRSGVAAFVYAPDDCRIILFEPDAAAVDRLAEIQKEGALERACTVAGTASETE